jgi:hypothetical protein
LEETDIFELSTVEDLKKHEWRPLLKEMNLDMFDKKQCNILIEKIINKVNEGDKFLLDRNDVGDYYLTSLQYKPHLGWPDIFSFDYEDYRYELNAFIRLLDVEVTEDYLLKLLKQEK